MRTGHLLILSASLFLLQTEAALITSSAAELPQNEQLSEVYEENGTDIVFEGDDAVDMISPEAGDNAKTATVTLDLYDEVAQLGGHPMMRGEDPAYDRADDRTDEELRSDLEEAIKDLEEELDVSGYKLDKDVIRRSVIDAINDNPAFFNVEDVSVVVNKKSGNALTVKFSYAADAEERLSEYDEEVDRILSGIRKSWTDEVKLLYLHDYLVTHCKYDLSYKGHSAYDAIVGRLSVCQGYALAYMDLARRAGLSVYYVSSYSINHGWNIAELDGEKYFIDCTWDDPIAEGANGDCHYYDMYCLHKNFLCSQSQMKATGHEGTDWNCGGDSVYDMYDNKTYDKAVWKRAGSSPVVILKGGSVLYIGKATAYDGYSAYEYDPAEGTETEYDGDYENLSCPGLAKGKVYINDRDSIYRLDRSSGKLVFVYTLNRSEKKSGKIYGIEGEGAYIRYDIGKGNKDKDYVRSGYLKDQ